MDHAITYTNLFWLYLAGSLLGVVIEGVFCTVRYGRWETHTVSLSGPFCIIYGIGAVGFYIGAVLMRQQPLFIQFLLFALIATTVEYFCGAVLKFGLGMQAWDYSEAFLNLHGLVCPKMTLAWGMAGLVVTQFLPTVRKGLSLLTGPVWDTLCLGLSVYMAIDLFATAACILRWAARHYKIAPEIFLEHYIDRRWDDQWMAKRFCEWRFLEEFPEKNLEKMKL